VIHFIIAGFIGTIAYALFIAVFPVGRCRRCHGARVVTRRKGKRPCPRCKGVGRACRRGAVVAQRLLREHAGPWIRERARDAAERRRDTR
jgi:hypothetical protein